MSFQVLTSDSEASNNASFNDGVPRPYANFQPSGWGDYFLSYDSHTSEEEEEMAMRQVQEHKEEVRRMLGAAEKCSEKLSWIDLIQRLGLSYHFKDEINEVLEHFQNPANVDEEDENLYIMALRFRLLRQQGFFVSCEIFNKFTNENGDFKESIIKDEACLLSLYEASHLRMRGEKILDEALAFTTTHLEAMAMDSNSPFSEEAKYALKWPIYKTMPRLMSRHYISLYHNNPLKNNNAFLSFAKLDYNYLQKLYQKELAELTRWWRDQKFMEQLSFARDRVVECYIWTLGAYYEPKYSSNRRIFHKIIYFLTIIDDMYDAYATLDELQLFTEAIQRWDINSIEKLPNYMKGLYEAILEFYGEIEQDMCMDNNIPFALDCAKKAIKRQCRAYFVETKWFKEGYVPTIEEYMKVGVISIATYVLASVSFLALENVASKEVFQWVHGDPILLKANGVIMRLMNDITSHKFEQERGHVASAVECYMKQYEVTKEEAIAELKRQVEEAWKDIIEDYIKLCAKFPNVILDFGLNLSRAANFYYKERDGFTFVDRETKRLITSMLMVPI